MSTTSGPPERNYYNAYDPSSAAALAFTILFAVSAGVYIVQAIRGKAYWMWPLLVGVLGEVAGYAARYVSAKNQTSREAWLAQLLLIILAPNFLAALDYILFARLMFYVAPELSTLPPRWVGWIFISCDIIALVLQAAGGGSLGSVRTPAALSRAKGILLAGLAFQLVTFSVFTVAAIVFYLRTLKHRDTVARPKRGWVWVLAALEFSSVMILTRSVFRIIEFANTTLGQRGSEEFVKKEWVIYFLETAPILLACFVFNLIHPTYFGIPNSKLDRMGADGRPEIRRDDSLEGEMTEKKSRWGSRWRK